MVDSRRVMNMYSTEQIANELPLNALVAFIATASNMKEMVMHVPPVASSAIVIQDKNRRGQAAAGTSHKLNSDAPHRQAAKTQATDK